MARTARRVTGLDALCLAGGVALNAVANGRLIRERVVERLWVQPAAGDAGGALGAALLAWHRWFGGDRHVDEVHDSMRGALLGPAFDETEIEATLRAPRSALRTARARGRGGARSRAAGGRRVVGWFDGPMEFGPRALGARSILADARDPQHAGHAQPEDQVSRRIPPLRAERARRARRRILRCWSRASSSPYMLLVVPVRRAHRTEGEAGASADGDSAGASSGSTCRGQIFRR